MAKVRDNHSKVFANSSTKLNQGEGFFDLKTISKAYLRMFPLDELDRAIIDALQEDGRISNADLAEAIGLSASACHRRVRRLESEGVIEGYAAMVNRQLVGRGVSVFVEISLESQREELLDEFEAAVRRVPQVQSCHLMAGMADYLVHVTCKDVADYETIHRESIAVLPGVTRVRSNFAIRNVTDTAVVDLEASGV